ncbi:MAG: ribosome silencing factor [Acidiferrobacteraceae bacterium]|nr:ribosome silencing factor [Acidiferrobacteraceae bacterium]|tara:strand:+ start:1522 stop:1923 length:402 start_codon:yes stop_codon:yes gene_type:complete
MIRRSSSIDVNDTTRRLSSLITATLEDAKATDICQLDVRRLTDMTDFMVIASGTSHRHVHALSTHICKATAAIGIRPIGIEGTEENEWILIDYADVVVHLLMPKTREFYSLEKLWDSNLEEQFLSEQDTTVDS